MGMTQKEIDKEKKAIEQEIKKLLKKTGSDFSLGDVERVIYNEDGQDSLTEAVAMFDNGDIDNLSNVLEALNDAWNYFPHKILNGKSPMEKVLEYELKDKPRISKKESIRMILQAQKEPGLRGDFRKIVRERK